MNATDGRRGAQRQDEQIKKLRQKIGDLVVDNDILRGALKPYPLDRKILIRVWGENR